VIELTCVSITGCQAPLELLERLSYRPEEVGAALPSLRAASGAAQLAVLSTCQRSELYAAGLSQLDASRLVAALATERGLPVADVAAAASVSTGANAARHLLRVSAGLESFALGETEVAGQVRLAAAAARASGSCGPELDAWLRAAVSTSRRVHRQTSFVATGRSTGSAAVDAVAAAYDGTLAGRKLLVVGAGQIATSVVARAQALGATVTVCNRTRRHAQRFAAAGVRVVDLVDLATSLGDCDAAILATAAPHPLVDVPMITAGRSSLVLVDLSLPRNVAPAVRELSRVRLMDLDDLRRAGSAEAGVLAADVDAAEHVVETELARLLRWLHGRSAATAVHRMRATTDAAAAAEMDRVAARIPPELHGLVEQSLLRLARRLAHEPTRQALAAAAAGDQRLVEALSGVFGGPDDQDGAGLAVTAVSAAAPSSPADDLDAAPTVRAARLGSQRRQRRTGDEAGDERGVHPADQIAV
jgi:glutamyl-tRNA reductase